MVITQQKRGSSIANLKYMQPVNHKFPAVLLMENVKRVLCVYGHALSVVEVSLTYRFTQKTGKFRHVKHSFTVLHARRIESPISDMQHLSSQSLSLYREIRSLCDRFGIDAVVASPGTTPEYGCMLGILSNLPAVHYALPERFSEWTDELKQKPIPIRVSNLESELLPDRLYTRIGLTKHEIKSVILAVQEIRRSFIKRFDLDSDLSCNYIRILNSYLRNHHEPQRNRREASGIT
jgi:hypothetical protein